MSPPALEEDWMMERFKEPRRARRIRERRRMVRRAWRKQAATCSAVPGSRSFWRDSGGRTRRFETWEDVHEFRTMRARRWADNLKICTCYACGNPRRHFKAATRQECLGEVDEKEQMEEESEA